MCEQTAPDRHVGDSYIRRPASEYIRMLKKVGFKQFECSIIDFGLHRVLFERGVGKAFISYYMKHHNENDRHVAMLKLNQNGAYRLFSEILATLSFPKVHKKANRWGYCFIVAHM